MVELISRQILVNSAMERRASLEGERVRGYVSRSVDAPAESLKPPHSRALSPRSLWVK